METTAAEICENRQSLWYNLAKNELRNKLRTTQNCKTKNPQISGQLKGDYANINNVKLITSL